MIKFFFKSFLLIIFIIGSIFSFNYFVYTHYIHKGYDFHKKITNILIQGYTAVGMHSFDSALAKRLYLENTTKKKLDVLILGTSKVMFIGKDMLKGKKYYNASILLGTIKEYETMFYICEKNGFVADDILIEIDHRLFSQAHDRWNYLSIYDKYWEFLKWIYPDQDTTRSLIDKINFIKIKYENYFSISYLHQTIKTITSENKIFEENIYAIQSDDPDTFGDGWVIHPDGRMHFPGWYRTTSQEKLNSSVKQWIASNSKDHYYKDQIISDKLVQDFIDFVMFLKRIGKKVYFFIPPYNPLLYNAIKDDTHYDIFKRVEDLTRKIAKANNVKIIGTFNPNKYNLVPDDYYDHWHSKEEVMEKIFNDIDL